MVVVEVVAVNVVDTCIRRAVHITVASSLLVYYAAVFVPGQIGLSWLQCEAQSLGS